MPKPIEILAFFATPYIAKELEKHFTIDDLMQDKDIVKMTLSKAEEKTYKKILKARR
jgi:hypothetical protein